MRQRSVIAAMVFFFSLCMQPLAATFLSVEQTSPRVSNVALLFSNQVVRPGSDFEGVIEFFLDPGWHVYWKNPGEVGTAPSFDWELPPGITLKQISWPTPSRLQGGGTFFYGYAGNPKWIVTFSVDASVQPGTYPMALSAFWLLCDGTCVPASQQFETSVTVSVTAPEPAVSEAVARAKELLPIQLSGGSIHADQDQLIVCLPVQEPKDVRSIVLFPEQKDLFTVDQLPQWEWKDETLVLTIRALKSAPDILLKAKRCTGLCQLIAASKTVTYSFDIPYELSPPREFGKGRSAALGSSENALYVALFLATIGGLLLNFTPCVLPVIGLKVLTLLSLKEAKRWQILLYGLVYTFGVLATFWALAGTLYLFESFGSTMGWGFQLQEPRFVMVLTVLLLCLSLNLFGLLEAGSSIAAWASGVEYHSGLSSRTSTLSAAFISGILATLIATPCTGPLLGSVLGFASVFNPVEGLLIFSAVGLGMSLPMLAITAVPPLIRLLPKPGLWMVRLKQFFGFCTLATMVWLLWVLSSELPSLSCVVVLTGLLLVAFGLWIFGQWGSPVRPRLTRIVGRLFALFFALCGLLILAASVDPRVAQWVRSTVPERPAIQWQPYSKSLRNEEVEKGNTVFVAFSAKWCLTCQTNKLSFLSEKVVDAFKAHHIVALEADWTNGDERITTELRALGRNGVPVYAIYRKGHDPLVLPELVTPDIIIHSVETSSQ